jgi:hypothetical protein
MANETLRKMFLELVETQIESNHPAVVRETLDRLMQRGYARDESIRLIGAALVDELHTVLSTQQAYDEDRYSAALAKIE